MNFSFSQNTALYQARSTNKITMKSLIIILTLLLVYSLSVKAQTEKRCIEVVIQPQLFIPVSDFKTTNKLSFGGYISLEKIFNEKMRFLLSFGGGLFPGKEFTYDAGIEDTYPAIALMQFRPGIKYFVYEDRLWISALVGAGYSFKGEKSFGFSYSPGLGYAVIADKFDVSVRYDASAFKGYSVNGIGFSLGYHLRNNFNQ